MKKLIIRKLEIENPELKILKENIKNIKGKISKDRDKAFLLYVKKLIEIAELYDLEDYEELIEEIYLLQYDFMEEDGFSILSEEVIKFLFKLQGLKSLTKASYELEKVLELYI